MLQDANLKEECDAFDILCGVCEEVAKKKVPEGTWKLTGMASAATAWLAGEVIDVSGRNHDCLCRAVSLGLGTVFPDSDSSDFARLTLKGGEAGRQALLKLGNDCDFPQTMDQSDIDDVRTGHLGRALFYLIF